MTLFRKILFKLHVGLFQRDREGRIAALAAREPTYAAFLQVLTQGEAVGVRGHPWRALDIEKVLRMLAPKRIAELGSGTSTGIFASYVRERDGASLISVDETEHWAGLTRAGLEAVGLAPHPRIDVVASRRIEGRRGSHYAFTIEPDIDLVYVDGPSVSKRDGKGTPNEDVLRAFEAGHFPRAIVVDGRIETVDAIRRHPGGRGYAFTPGLSYLAKAPDLELRDVLAIGAFHRHSLFVRKPDA
ncbi:hypothetical protein [Salinarimonas sp.]|uniref:hypothetical protein n=1 Tax=Salinarimonas sp. TaxID=2766526 RepID=UPI0032D8B782